MGREGVQIVVYWLKAIKSGFTTQCRTCRFNRIGAVHADKGVQILQRLTLLFLRQ